MIDFPVQCLSDEVNMCFMFSLDLGWDRPPPQLCSLFRPRSCKLDEKLETSKEHRVQSMHVHRKRRRCREVKNHTSVVAMTSVPEQVCVCVCVCVVGEVRRGRGIVSLHVFVCVCACVCVQKNL